jgi:hypothetical protein
MTTPGSPAVTLVIPCSGAKASKPEQARALYTGDMFRHTLRAALAAARWCDDHGVPARVLILSAKHGLISLARETSPYDLKMGDPGSVTPDTLAGQARQLGITPGHLVCAFLPRLYLARLEEALRDGGAAVRDMYKGTRGIGEQRHVNAEVTRHPGAWFPGAELPGPAGGAAARSEPAAPAAGAR